MAKNFPPPSKFQLAVYEAVKTGTGNLFVKAVAGSGKTTVLVAIADLLDDELLMSCAFAAFSKEIQKALVKRLPREVWCKTIHAFGLMALGKLFKKKDYEGWIDDRKYPNLIDEALAKAVNLGRLNRETIDQVSDSLNKAVRYCQVTMTDPKDSKAFAAMLDHFAIEPVDHLAMMTSRILERGMEMAALKISQSDMVWLALKLNAPFKKFKFILADEAQDLSNGQREIIKRMCFPDTRLVFVGDSAQAIFSFAGAEIDSVDRIIAGFKCESLPLSVCYRCTKKSIRRAQKFVPEIMWRDDAPEGDEFFIKLEDMKHKVKAERRDMVMCRTNAPLVELALDLIGAGIAIKMRGHEFMSELVSTAKATMKLPGATWENFQDSLNGYVGRQTVALSRKADGEQLISNLMDRSRALSVIVARAQALDQRIKTIEGLKKFIDRLFGTVADEETDVDAVMLSSIHRAKGLEADHVFILGYDSLMPSKAAKTPEDLHVEDNLCYVALTRNKQSLTFVSMPEAA